MSLTRPSHDDDAYNKAVVQSASSGHYMLQTPHICGGGEALFPQVMQGQNAASLCDRNTNLVDVDSELMGITHKLSHCPPIPSSNFKGLEIDFLKQPLDTTCGSGQDGAVNTFLTHENTRMTTSGPCKLRCSGWNRFDPLLYDVQKYIGNTSKPLSTNSRILMKDNYKPCLREPSEFTPAPALPKGYDTISDLTKYTGRPATDLPQLAQMPRQYDRCFRRG